MVIVVAMAEGNIIFPVHIGSELREFWNKYLLLHLVSFLYSTVNALVTAMQTSVLCMTEVFIRWFVKINTN
jgi:hypothetical protein